MGIALWDIAIERCLRLGKDRARCIRSMETELASRPYLRPGSRLQFLTK